MESLPDGVLTEVLLRLPFPALLPGKQVCKKWNRLIGSSFFSGTYRGRATLVEIIDYSVFACPTYEMVDSSSNTVLRWRKERYDHNFGGITLHINGVLLTYERDAGKHYVCNIFLDKWEQLPPTPAGFNVYETAVFGLGAGQYKLVYWGYETEEIWTLSTGQQEWSLARSSDMLRRSYSYPVVMGNSIFRVRRDGTLVEYTIQGDFRAKTIRHQERAFDFHGYGRVEVIAWKVELYMVLVEEQEWVEIWRLSAEDGRATFLNKVVLERRIELFDLIRIEGDGFLRVRGLIPNEGVMVSLLYDLKTHLVVISTATGESIARRQMEMVVSLDELEKIL